MTAVPPVRPAGAPAFTPSAPPARGRGLAQTRALIRRSLTNTVRQPGAWVPGLAFPLLVAAVFTANYHQAARLIGFPGHISYTRYVLPGTVLIGAMYAGTAAGAEVTGDLRSGFLQRLMLAPGRRSLLLVGPLVAAAAQAVVQGGLFLAVFSAFGVTPDSGVAGVLVLLGSSVLFAVGVGALAIALGLRTAEPETMESLFGVLFVLLFVSSTFYPPALMRGWFQAAAEGSPLSYLADGMRSQVAAGPHGPGGLHALLGGGALCLVALLAALAALRSATGRRP